LQAVPGVLARTEHPPQALTPEFALLQTTEFTVLQAKVPPMQVPQREPGALERVMHPPQALTPEFALLQTTEFTVLQAKVPPMQVPQREPGALERAEQPPQALGLMQAEVHAPLAHCSTALAGGGGHTVQADPQWLISVLLKQVPLQACRVPEH
jgi:hypothetical protein